MQSATLASTVETGLEVRAGQVNGSLKHEKDVLFLILLFTTMPLETDEIYYHNASHFMCAGVKHIKR